MLDELMKEVTQLVSAEYSRASKEHGMYTASDHESFALILEEFQEGMEEAVKVNNALNNFWMLVRSDDDYNKIPCLNALYQTAIRCACEFIQVANVAYKAELSIKKGGELRE